VWQEWNLQCYLMRGHFISLSRNAGTEWRLTEGPEAPPAGYRRIDLGTRVYTVWQRTEAGGPAR
jgi:hypothetical protein